MEDPYLAVKKDKNNYFSIAKALGIILMVIGHVGMSDFSIRYIYMFHMPLFFFCSGYFLKQPNSIYDMKSYVLRRIKRLYIPYVKWSVLFLLFHNTFCQIGLYERTDFCHYDIVEILNRFMHIITSMNGHEQLLDPFWFLKQLFLSSIIISFSLYFLRRCPKWNRMLFLFLGVIFLSSLCKSYNVGLPILWDLSIIFLSAVFFLMGYMYRQIERKEWYRVDTMFISFVIVGIVTFVYGESLDMLWYNSYTMFIYVVVAPLGIYGTLCMSYIVDKYKIRYILCYIGNHTMPILALHLLSFKMITFFIIRFQGLSIQQLSDFKVIKQDFGLFVFIAYILTGILVPLIFDASFRRIKVGISKHLNISLFAH